MSNFYDLWKSEQPKSAKGLLYPLAEVPEPDISEPVDTIPESPSGPSILTTQNEPADVSFASELGRMECRPSAWNPDFSQILFNDTETSYSTEREQFRTLRSRLYQVRTGRPLKTVLISSALAAEGKTLVAANLARVLAQQSEQRVLLVDADLRQPRLHTVLGAPQGIGLCEFLHGQCDELEVIQRSPFGELYFAAAGASVQNPGDLIANGRLKIFVQRVSSLFDWIVVDSPPVIPVTDASLIAEACDGVILVLRANATPFDVAQKARDEFRQTSLLGVVLNRVSTGRLYRTSHQSAPRALTPEQGF